MTADDYGQPVQWLGTSYTMWKGKKRRLAWIDPCNYRIHGVFMYMLSGPS